eukprot:jgi/Bigna1/81508/fgenesh1_pg.81_\
MELEIEESRKEHLEYKRRNREYKRKIRDEQEAQIFPLTRREGGNKNQTQILGDSPSEMKASEDALTPDNKDDIHAIDSNDDSTSSSLFPDVSAKTFKKFTHRYFRDCPSRVTCFLTRSSKERSIEFSMCHQFETSKIE